MLTGTPAQAQSYPSRPVTLIVPWPAGGSTDLAMRALADATQKHLGQPIVVENKPGAAGTLGPAQMAATGKPDGYTIAQIPITVFRIPFIAKTTYDPAKGLHLHRRPHRLHFRRGGQIELAVEDLQRPHRPRQGQPWQDQVRLAGRRHQPAHRHGADRQADRREVDACALQGAAPSLNAALLGGHIDTHANSTSWAALVNSGDFRLLVTWSPNRTRNWPNVPTLQELGINLVLNSPYGVAGPKGMDPKVVKVLAEAFAKGVQEP